MFKLNKILLVFCLLFSINLKAEPSYSLNNQEKVRILTTVIVSQAFSRTLADLNVGLVHRLLITDLFLIGVALTSEALNGKISKNNMTSVGIGLAGSNLISFSLDW
jgi:hypothetical protein